MTNLKNKATYSKRHKRWRKHLRFYFRTCVHVAATKISKGILLRDPHAYKSCFTFEDSFTTTYAYDRFSLTWFDFYITCTCLWIEFIKAKNNFNFKFTSTKRNIAVSQWEFRVKKKRKKKTIWRQVNMIEHAC